MYEKLVNRIELLTNFYDLFNPTNHVKYLE